MGAEDELCHHDRGPSRRHTEYILRFRVIFVHVLEPDVLHRYDPTRTAEMSVQRMLRKLGWPFNEVRWKRLLASHVATAFGILGAMALSPIQPDPWERQVVQATTRLNIQTSRGQH